MVWMHALARFTDQHSVALRVSEHVSLGHRRLSFSFGAGLGPHSLQSDATTSDEFAVPSTELAGA